MRKINQQVIEQRIREIEETPYSPSDERIEEIKQRAFEEYDRYLRAENKNTMRKHRKRSILHRVVAVFALAVCFFVSTFAYSVFAPVTIASANNFVRRASIWINNQLHLGITFSSPVDDADKVVYNDDLTVTTIEELRKIAIFPVVYIPESEIIKIDNIDLNIPSSNQQEISIWYSTIDNESIVVINELLFESNAIDLDTTSLEAIEAPIGTVYSWTDGAYSYALCFLEGSIMYITSSMSVPALEQYILLLSTLS